MWDPYVDIRSLVYYLDEKLSELDPYLAEDFSTVISVFEAQVDFLEERISWLEDEIADLEDGLQKSDEEKEIKAQEERNEKMIMSLQQSYKK